MNLNLVLFAGIGGAGSDSRLEIQLVYNIRQREFPQVRLLLVVVVQCDFPVAIQRGQVSTASGT